MHVRHTSASLASNWLFLWMRIVFEGIPSKKFSVKTKIIHIAPFELYSFKKTEEYDMQQTVNGLFPLLWNLFWKLYNSFISLRNLLNFWYVTISTTVILWSFSKFWLFLAKKAKSVNAFLNFFANFYAAPMNLQVFV